MNFRESLPARLSARFAVARASEESTETRDQARCSDTFALARGQLHAPQPQALAHRACSHTLARGPQEGDFAHRFVVRGGLPQLIAFGQAAVNDSTAEFTSEFLIP